MKIFFLIDVNKRLLGWSSTRGSSSEIEYEVPDNHEVLLNPFIFRYEKGKLIKDVAYQKHLIEVNKARKAKPSLEARLVDLEKRIQALEGK